MPIINPNNYTPSTGGGRRDAPPGDYTAIAIGHDYRNPQGKSLVEIRFIVLTDHDTPDDQTGNRGATFDLTFWLTERAMWRMENFAWATEYSEPFDPMIGDHLERVLLAGPVRVRIKAEERNGYTRMDTDGRFSRSSGWERDPTSGAAILSDADAEMVDGAADGWDRLMQARQKASGNGGGGGGGGGNNRPRTTGKTKSNSGPVYQDDDIPF